MQVIFYAPLFRRIFVPSNKHASLPIGVVGPIGGPRMGECAPAGAKVGCRFGEGLYGKNLVGHGEHLCGEPTFQACWLERQANVTATLWSLLF
jgi:hypothetical protein